MSAPTKCEKCGAEATYAIQMPCVMGCGGLMYYDKVRARGLPAALPEIREAQEAIKFLLKIAPEWKPDGPGGPLKCFSCGGYASSGHKPSCIVDSQFRRARTALGEGRPE